ncbi:MAG TPA: hypothetical protein VJH23_01175 [archaeon]|nr:hypothetical protein [archaeon]
MTSRQEAHAKKLDKFLTAVTDAGIRLKLSRQNVFWALSIYLLRLPSEPLLDDELGEGEYDDDILEGEDESLAPVKGPQEPKHYPGVA